MAVRTSIVRFGVFEVDPVAGELRRNGAKVKLQQQPFQILLLLLERRGEVVTRDELRQKLWPADTFVDFEHSVNAAIKRLRDALEDDARTPRYVETLPGRGYRWIGPFERDPVPLPTPTPVRRPWWKDKRVWAGAVTMCALVIVAAAVWWVRRPSPVSWVERRVTANVPEEPVWRAALSPDGKYLAYADPSGMYFKQVETGESKKAALPEGMKGVPSSWYPDGVHLLFTTKIGDEPRSLWSISLLGGELKKVLDDVSGASVSPDGDRIAVLRHGLPYDPGFTAFTAGGSIWIISPNGQPQELVKDAMSGAGHPAEWLGVPVWSPDNRSLAYVRSSEDQRPRALMVVDVATTKSREVMSNDSMGFTLCWGKDGRLFYWTYDGDEPRVWWIDGNTAGAGSTIPRVVTTGFGDVSALSASADGKRVAVTRMNSAVHVYVGDFDGDADRITNLRRLTSDARGSFVTAWTPDGESVLFSAFRNGELGIYKQNVEHRTEERMVLSKGEKWLPRVSPDGRSLLFGERSSPTSPWVWKKMPLEGGPTTEVWKTAVFANLQCSAAQANVCLTTKTENGKMTFLWIDLDTGHSEAIFQRDSNGPVNWSLSPDGNTLAMVDNSPYILFRGMRDGVTRRVEVYGYRLFFAVDWRSDGKAVLTPSRTADGASVLLSVDPQGRAKELLRGAENEFIQPGITSPDSKHIALGKNFGESNVWLLERK